MRKWSVLLGIFFMALVILSGFTKTALAEKGNIDYSKDAKSQVILNNQGELLIFKNDKTTGSSIKYVVSDVSDSEPIKVGTVVNLSARCIEDNNTTGSAVRYNTTGSVIIFTDNGSIPTADNGIVFESEITIEDDSLIKARVYEGGFYGEVAVFDYKVLKASGVTSNVKSGDVEYGTKIELKTESEGAEIFYEIEDIGFSSTTPQSIKYEKPIEITRSQRIMAYSKKDGYKNSEVKIFEYEVKDQLVMLRTEKDNIKKGEYTEFTVKVRNTLVEDKEVSLFIAVYDSEDKMIDYMYIWDNLKSLESVEMEAGIFIEKNAQYVKSYMLDSVAGIKPISNTIRIEVK